MAFLGVSNRSLGPPPPVGLWPDPLPDGTVGVAYSYFLTSFGGFGTVTYATDAAGTAFLASVGLTLNASTGEVGSGGIALATTVSFTGIKFWPVDSYGN